MDTYAVPGKLRLKKKAKGPSMSAGVAKIHKPKIPLATQIQDALVKYLEGKRKTEAERASVEEEEESTTVEIEPEAVAPKKTKAEISFQKRQDELLARRVLEKAKTSHREKVEKFNNHMETLTEFNDIPKVSWTK